MDVLIKTTFTIILCFSAVNFAYNVIGYFSSKKRDQLLLANFWLALIVNFFIQGAAQADENQIIASFAFSLLPASLLCLSLFSFLNKKITNRFLFTNASIAIILSFTFIVLDIGSFTIRALPISIGGAIAMLYTAYFMTKESKGRPLFKVAAFILVLTTIHGVNFAFFRNQPGNQVWGWLTAYALYQVLAALLPALALVEYSRDEKNRLTQIINEKTQALKASNAELAANVGFKEFLFKTLSHDIATPIMIAMNSINLLTRGEHDERTTKALNRTKVSLDKISEILIDLRSLEINDPHTHQIPLSQCVEKIESEFSAMLQDKQIDLNVDPNIEDVIVEVHPSTFTNSVLSNILRNAIKFSERNSKININLEMKSENRVLICIEDFGLGIPNEILENIFHFSSESSRPGTEGEQGTGWGLPIAQTILKNYGGDIYIESQTSNDKNSNSFTRVFIEVNGFLKNNSERFSELKETAN